MNTHICPRCDNKFYTAVPGGVVLKCPFCGYESKDGFERRTEQRARILRECTVQREAGAATARVVDISCKGIGLVFSGEEEVSEGEVLRLEVSDFDLDSMAVVVWTGKGQGHETAGLKFI